MRKTETIKTEHQAIHEGRAFSFSKDFTIASGGTASIIIKTPAASTSEFVHLKRKNLSAGAELFNISFYEDITATYGTSTLIAHNRNRNSSSETGVIIYDSPSSIVRTNATLLINRLASGGDDNKGSAGDETINTAEWILKPASYYEIKIDNDGDGEAVCTLNGFFYTTNILNF